MSGMGPYAEADYNLTLYHSRLQSQALHPSDKECFPNYSKKDGEYEEGEEKGWELTLCLRIDIYGAWATPCLS
jgi:hypothetical protein